MKRTTHAVLGFLAVAVLAGPPLPAAAAAQDAQETPAAPQVEALEARVTALETELEATRTLLDETVSYLQAQAQAASRLSSALDAAEAAGFTAGINYKSRELLMSGWRAEIAAAQEQLPGAPAAAPVD